MSGNFTIRPVEPGDRPALGTLWADCFGDDAALIDVFFALLPELGVGAAAELDGEAVGMAYAICGMELSDGRRVGYIYAVAVDERCRSLGIGTALTRAAADAARTVGAEIICTLPANDPLYPWYEKLIGTHHILRRRCESVSAGSGTACRLIGAAEYNSRREALLSDVPHLRVSTVCMELQALLCSTYGGGLYALNNGIAAAYLDGGKCVIRELICPDGERAENAAALAGLLGAETAELFSPDPEGEKYVALDSPVPPDTVWNIAFD